MLQVVRHGAGGVAAHIPTHTFGDGTAGAMGLGGEWGGRSLAAGCEEAQQRWRGRGDMTTGPLRADRLSPAELVRAPSALDALARLGE